MNEITDQEMIAGGARVSVRTLQGESLEIFVRQMKVSELADYLRAEARGDVPLLEQVTGQPKEVLESLTLDSFEALLEADRKQNFSYARQKEKRDMERLARQMEQLQRTSPEMYAEAQSQVKAAMESAILSLTPSAELNSIGGRPPQS